MKATTTAIARTTTTLTTDNDVNNDEQHGWDKGNHPCDVIIVPLDGVEVSIDTSTHADTREKEAAASAAAAGVEVGKTSTEESEGLAECWICRDSSRAEPLIQPCACRGSMSGVHASCVEDWIRHHRANAQDGEVPKCSVCKQPYRGTEQRPGPMGFVQHLCHNFSRQALRSAFLVGMLFAYWIGVQEDFVGTLLGYTSTKTVKVDWPHLGNGPCLGPQSKPPQYYAVEFHTEENDALTGAAALPEPIPRCQEVCESLWTSCQGITMTLPPSNNCWVHSSAPPQESPHYIVEGPWGDDNTPIVTVGASQGGEENGWTCFVMRVPPSEESELTAEQRMVQVAIRVVLLTCSGVFFAHKTLVLSLSIPRWRTPPAGVWRHFYIADFKQVAVHIAEAAASIFIAALWSVYGQLPFYYFLPLSAMALAPLGTAILMMDARTGRSPCTYRTLVVLAFVLASPVLLVMNLGRAFMENPRRMVDPFDGLLHIFFPVVALPLCWFCSSNAPVIIVWGIHSVLLSGLICEKAFIQRAVWKDGRIWWIFVQLVILAVYVGNLLHNFSEGFLKDMSFFLVLGVSMTWLSLSCLLVFLVNWQLCLRQYRAWQQRNGSFTLSSNGNSTLGAQVIGVTSAADRAQGSQAELARGTRPTEP